MAESNGSSDRRGARGVGCPEVADPTKPPRCTVPSTLQEESKTIVTATRLLYWWNAWQEVMRPWPAGSIVQGERRLA